MGHVVLAYLDHDLVAGELIVFAIVQCDSQVKAFPISALQAHEGSKKGGEP